MTLYRPADERRRVELERARLLSTVAPLPSSHAAKVDRLEELDRELERLRRLERWQYVDPRVRR